MRKGEPEMDDRLYPLTYDLRMESPPVPRSELEKQSARGDDRGGCDAAILVSIMFGPTGGSSHMIISRDGRNGLPLDDQKVFQAWAIMANHIAERFEGLTPDERQICREAFEKVRRLVLRNRPGPGLA